MKVNLEKMKRVADNLREFLAVEEGKEYTIAGISEGVIDNAKDEAIYFLKQALISHTKEDRKLTKEFLMLFDEVIETDYI